MHGLVVAMIGGAIWNFFAARRHACGNNKVSGSQRMRRLELGQGATVSNLILSQRRLANVVPTLAARSCPPSSTPCTRRFLDTKKSRQELVACSLILGQRLTGYSRVTLLRQLRTCISLQICGGWLMLVHIGRRQPHCPPRIDLRG